MLIIHLTCKRDRSHISPASFGQGRWNRFYKPDLGMDIDETIYLRQVCGAGAGAGADGADTFCPESKSEPEAPECFARSRTRSRQKHTCSGSKKGYYRCEKIGTGILTAKYKERGNILSMFIISSFGTSAMNDFKLPRLPKTCIWHVLHIRSCHWPVTSSRAFNLRYLPCAANDHDLRTEQ